MLWLAVVAAALLWPRIVDLPYLIGVAITALLYMALSLSFDLIVGRAGLLSFAHPGFFGIGAYVAALMGLHLGSSFPFRIAGSMLAAIAFALVVGVPSFRLSYYTFAIGTLGFTLIMQLVATNWIDVTRGPLCLNGIPPADLRFGDWRVVASDLSHYYYLILGMVAVTYWLVLRLVRSRIGRTLIAIREDELLGAAMGVPLVKYKLLAFGVGAGVAGAVGAYYASYATVVCPTELATIYTVNLIVILFLGGRGTIAGPIVGAVLFTGLPEFLRVAQEWRLIIYGILIILGGIYLPEGIITRTSTHWRWLWKGALT